MKRKSSFLFLGVVVSTLFFWPGCQKKEGPPEAGPSKLTAGPAVQVLSVPVPPSGGEVVVNKPGDPLDGLSIKVPEGAFAESRAFTLSSAPIRSHRFGQRINPITPLITIENGGGYSAKSMRLTIPCVIPEGYHAMVFAYDEETGTLEGIPTLSYDSASIKVATRTLDYSPLPGLEEDRSNGPGEPHPSVQLFASKVSREELALELELGLSEDFKTNFEPGKDDWPFPNLGSYYARDGLCAGKSITELWYKLYQTRDNLERLFTRLDNDGHPAFKTPKVWEDDVLGYQFASVVQNDEWGEEVKDLDEILAEDEERIPGEHDFNTLLDFAYAISRNHRAQFVSVFPKKGTPGHAMVVYKVAKNELHIADANKPGDPNVRIRYQKPKFQPYVIGKEEFPVIHWWSERSRINLRSLNARWKEVKNRTIGKGKFPEYTVEVNDKGAWPALWDGFVTNSPTLSVRVLGNDTKPVPAKIYGEDQTILAVNKGDIPLAVGSHRYGLYITDDSEKIGEWIGFRWFTIEYQPAAASRVLDVIANGVAHSFDKPQISWAALAKSKSLTITASDADGKKTFYLYVRGVTGAGTFKIEDANWHDDPGVWQSRSWDPKAPATVTITEYDGQHLKGTFTFLGYGARPDIQPPERQVGGQFEIMK